MKILDQEISCFRNYFVVDNPAPVNLLKWLKTDKYRAQVEAIRETSNSLELASLKKQLPAITPSGLFSKRNRSGLVRHSGLICIDIDRKGNEWISNFADLKREFSKLKNVAYAGLSVSGSGFFLLIPIERPEYHLEYFFALEEDFEALGISIDRSCSNVDRLRGASWDPEGFFNPSPVIYSKRKQKAPTLPDHGYTIQETAKPATTQAGQKTPWDDFNSKASGIDILTRHGWEIVRETPQRIYLRRPGNTTAPTSGNIDKARNIFVCHSSSTVFEPGKGYAPAALLALLEHGGNFKETGKRLRIAGYGG
jgi:hypothetical protein